VYASDPAIILQQQWCSELVYRSVQFIYGLLVSVGHCHSCGTNTRRTRIEETGLLRINRKERRGVVGFTMWDHRILQSRNKENCGPHTKRRR
jgi:hypothetical protein